MTRDVAIDHARALLEIRLTGLIDGAAIGWGIGQIEQKCRSDDIACVVWDLRNADLSQLSFSVIQGTVSDWPSIALDENARIAVVAGSERDEILLQLWREAGRHRDNRERKVFLNIDDARNWTAERER